MRGYRYGHGGKVGKLKPVLIGFAAGFIATAAIFGIVAMRSSERNRHMEAIQNAQLEIELMEMREEINSLGADDLLDYAPGIRRAAEGAAGGFDRRLDEILWRFGLRRAD